MENKLCRTCGKFTEQFVNIFRTEGLKDKLETCLPIIVSPHCLLPDTICTDCYENVKSYYSFIKNCLQSIIILEAQLDVNESCLKSKRKHEKSSCTDFYNPPVLSTKTSQHEEEYNIAFCTQKINAFSKQIAEAEKILNDPFEISTIIPKPAINPKLVQYDSSSDDNHSDRDDREEMATNINNKLYFDDKENDLINEIAERKSQKRKSQEILNSSTKIFKLDTNRRKRRQPVKVETVTNDAGWNFNILEQIYEGMHENNFEQNVLVKQELIEQQNPIEVLPQVCLLCDSQFSGPPQLATHVFEVHGIDMAQIASAEPVMEKKKKIPNLVKITDLKQKRESLEAKSIENGEEPPTLEPTFVCPLCPASLTNKSDLFLHLRQKHPNRSDLICGLCLYMATSYANLTDHLVNCVQTHPINQPFICKICKYNEDNQRNLENHVLVHEFVANFCKKKGAIFDPGDYVELNPNCESTKTYPCNECGTSFVIFKEFSSHRRSQHSIFHCDLCNKFYGRNSHLWKHVNRLHKGHPSITCQFCYKTSASKYHLSQHFNKIHTIKTGTKLKNGDGDDEELLPKKIQRQEIIKKEDISQVPKEIDRSSDLYTNIITNYTPPVNKGEFKCQKCSKGFHKKTLLKKHKKNCRPRLQKDLLTRCKTCSRIFKDRQSLAKHLVNYHSEYVCEICNEKVQSKCEIVSHIRFSHPSCHLFCKECANVLRCQEDLEIHSKDHSNSFVCQFCGDLLPSRIKLKMHILSLHRKILNLSCGVCLKLFETQHILRDHVRLTHHDVLLPLTTCTVCGKNYGSKWKTYDHINKSHGRIFKACKACLEVFDTDLDLESHYYEIHGNTPKEKPIKKEIVTKKEPVIYESEPERDEKNSSSAVESSSDQEETKMSLLEKRLTTPEEPKVFKKENNKKLVLKSENDSNYAPDQNGSNSSKRTVYVNSNDPSFCEICFKTWPAKKHLWQHYIRCHKLVAATVCGICLKTNDNYEMLQKHLIENHPTLLHGKGFGSNFICRICGRYHNASSKLRLHMAIHENFDWRLFDNIPIKQETSPNESINYENLIEQVECSSDDSSSSSDSDNDESDETNAENKTEVASKTDDESSTSQSVHVKSENCSSDEEEEDDEDDDDDDLYDDNALSNNSDAGAKSMNLYRHPDVVNSAVESICYEDEEYDEDFNNHSEYMEVQNHNNLNPHEIQSAVDSIL